MPAILPTTRVAAIPSQRIISTFLNHNPTYRAMIRPTSPMISTDQRSGMARKRAKKIPFNIINERINSGLLRSFCFLSSQAERKITYPSLKNSAGWILGSPGILIHPLAPLSETPMPGINTINWSKMSATAMMTIFLLFWKNLIGILYTASPMTSAIKIFLRCL